ncbi:hypothetical protein SELMODRAFT_402495 [Selaginella moellendorffii]|uniref:Uncharacterized protein n=1 Tax=Selaginella moellendorffii TaxID=88036 RepID=D8QQU5_SELML|nr:hypothetical protein SELMODRAFT_402495 [Selaginella moellendorffii]
MIQEADTDDGDAVEQAENSKWSVKAFERLLATVWRSSWWEISSDLDSTRALDRTRGTQSASHEKTLEREIADSLSIIGSDDAVTSFCDYHMSSCSCDFAGRKINFISRFQSECIAVLCKPRQINKILLVEKFGEKE